MGSSLGSVEVASELFHLVISLCPLLSLMHKFCSRCCLCVGARSAGAGSAPCARGTNLSTGLSCVAYQQGGCLSPELTQEHLWCLSFGSDSMCWQQRQAAPGQRPMGGSGAGLWAGRRHLVSWHWEPALGLKALSYPATTRHKRQHCSFSECCTQHPSTEAFHVHKMQKDSNSRLCLLSLQLFQRLLISEPPGLFWSPAFWVCYHP